LVWVSSLVQIKKRDGRIVPFDQNKIVDAILKAAMAVHGSDEARARELAEAVVKAVDTEARDAMPTVESIQDTIEKVLIAQGHARTAKAFILYRANRSRIREGKSELMETVGELLVADAPAAGTSQPVPRLAAIGAAASREFYLNRVLSEAHADAHLNGDWHIHGLSHYALAPHGVALPYRRLLSTGFAVGHGSVRAPRTAHEAAIATVALLQSAQADCHGALVLSAFDAAWGDVLPADTTDAELRAALATLVTCLNVLSTQASGQLAAATLQIGLDAGEPGRRVALALMAAIADGLGHGEPVLRPHLVVCVKPGVNLHPGDPNHEVLQQALALACRWPGVTFVHEPAAGVAYLGHEARVEGDGAGLAARLTLNLPRLALGARRDSMPFLRAIDEALEAAAAQLAHRLDALGKRPVGDFPLVMAQGLHAGAADLDAQAPIAEAIRCDQLGIGFVGLAEALVVLHGVHHGASVIAQAEGLRLVEHLAARCATLSASLGIRLVLQAGEGDEVAGRFARLDRRTFGMIRGVTETPAYTSGVAIPDACALPLADRLAREAAFGPHLAGGDVFVWRLAGAPTPEALASTLDQAIAAGHRAFSVEYPVTLGEGRALVRRRGYLAIEG
jgi:ribonucleoside-triphosphate reductase